MFVMVDLYAECCHSSWIDALPLSVHLFSIEDYCDLFEKAGFEQITFEQTRSSAPLSPDWNLKQVRTGPLYEAYLEYRKTGSLVIKARKNLENIII